MRLSQRAKAGLRQKLIGYLSFTPGFSPVIEHEACPNRFNGLLFSRKPAPRDGGETVETVPHNLCGLVTGLKPGENESST